MILENMEEHSSLLPALSLKACISDATGVY